MVTLQMIGQRFSDYLPLGEGVDKLNTGNNFLGRGGLIHLWSEVPVHDFQLLLYLEEEAYRSSTLETRPHAGECLSIAPPHPHVARSAA